MQRISSAVSYNPVLVEKLRTKISHIGRWHMKGRRSDSTRIWKMLFGFIEEIMEAKYPFSERAYIRILVYPRHKQYSFMVHRHNSTCYRGYVARREENYEKIIKALNSVLAHYDLTLVETEESLKSSLRNSFNGHKEYEIKFVDN